MRDLGTRLDRLGHALERYRDDLLHQHRSKLMNEHGRAAYSLGVRYVCLRPSHHRRRASGVQLGQHLGCPAYCPAGDVEGHEWMPALTDVERLGCVGLCPPTCPENEQDPTAQGEDELLLIGS